MVLVAKQTLLMDQVLHLNHLLHKLNSQITNTVLHNQFLEIIFFLILASCFVFTIPWCPSWAKANTRFLGALGMTI